MWWIRRDYGLGNLVSRLVFSCRFWGLRATFSPALQLIRAATSGPSMVVAGASELGRSYRAASLSAGLTRRPFMILGVRSRTSVLAAALELSEGLTTSRARAPTALCRVSTCRSASAREHRLRAEV